MAWGWAGQRKTYDPHFIIGPARLSKSLVFALVSQKSRNEEEFYPCKSRDQKYEWQHWQQYSAVKEGDGWKLFSWTSSNSQAVKVVCIGFRITVTLAHPTHYIFVITFPGNFDCNTCSIFAFVCLLRESHAFWDSNLHWSSCSDLENYCDPVPRAEWNLKNLVLCRISCELS